MNSTVLTELLHRLTAARQTDIGFPGAHDFDYRELEPLWQHLLNNVGDPDVDPIGVNHTKAIEREVVDFFADLFRSPPQDRWGYVTSGGTEGNIEGLYLARCLYPGALLYRSAAAHYSVGKAADLLGLPVVTIRADAGGEMDYDDLRAVVSQNRHRPAIVAATIGTTMTEAVDDLAQIARVLDDLVIQDRYIHADAAMAGIPRALLETPPRFELADSVSISGHKFLGSPIPCGVVVARRSARDRVGRAVSYTGSPDTTISGSRSGHAPVLLWYAIRRHGIAGLRRRAEAARALAEYTLDRLTAAGWHAWRNPDAFTVVLKSPPAAVTDRWPLAHADGWSHIVCMPGITYEQIDAFVDELRAFAGARPVVSTSTSRCRR